MTHSTPGRARLRTARSGLCASTGTVQAGRRHDPLRRVAGRRRGSRSQAQAAGPRRLDHGDPDGARRGDRAQGVRAQLQARRADRAGPGRVDRTAARARRARRAGDRRQGAAGSWPGSPRSRRRWSHGDAVGAAACLGCRRRRGRASSTPRCAGTATITESVAVLDGIHLGAIGFGIGPVKCGTCSPACRPRKQSVSGALGAP